MPPNATAAQQTTETINGRLEAGRRFIERGLLRRDRIAIRRFLDGSEMGPYLLFSDSEYDAVGVLPETQEIGNVNYLAINILTKVDSIAIGDPDWHVEADDDAPTLDPMTGQPVPDNEPTNSEIIRRYLKDLWKNKRWADVTKAALLRRAISGMGCVAYLWHEELGPMLESVDPGDLSIDPNVKDWRNLRWGARRISVPLEEARVRWPRHDFGTAVADIPNMDDHNATKEVAKIWCYWDWDGQQGIEAMVDGEDILEQGPNLYEHVPLLFMLGSLAPGTAFRLGDYDLASGLQIQLSRLTEVINNQAENGGHRLDEPGLTE